MADNFKKPEIVAPVKKPIEKKQSSMGILGLVGNPLVSPALLSTRKKAMKK